MITFGLINEYEYKILKKLEEKLELTEEAKYKIKFYEKIMGKRNGRI